eukprot:1982280-Pleurochrysis_carterae.AAC.1
MHKLDELGSFLATGGDAKIVQIWDLSSLSSSTGEAVSERPATSFKCTTIIYSVALTAAGKRAVHVQAWPAPSPPPRDAPPHSPFA